MLSCFVEAVRNPFDDVAHLQLDLDLALHRLQRPLRVKSAHLQEGPGLSGESLGDPGDVAATRRVLQLQCEQQARARDHRAEAGAAERKVALQLQSDGTGDGNGDGGGEDAEEGLQLFSRSYNLWQSFKKKVSSRFN